MHNAQFDDEPLSDKEVFAMLRGGFSDDKSCWQAVREAQEAYKDLHRQIVLREIEEERNERDNYSDDYYAA